MFQPQDGRPISHLPIRKIGATIIRGFEPDPIRLAELSRRAREDDLRWPTGRRVKKIGRPGKAIFSITTGEQWSSAVLCAMDLECNEKSVRRAVRHGFSLRGHRLIRKKTQAEPVGMGCGYDSGDGNLLANAVGAA